MNDAQKEKLQKLSFAYDLAVQKITGVPRGIIILVMDPMNEEEVTYISNCPKDVGLEMLSAAKLKLSEGLVH